MVRYIGKKPIMISLFLVFTFMQSLSLASAASNVDFPEEGAVFNSSPSHISIILPDNVTFSQDSVKVIASNAMLVPIRSIEYSGKVVTINTSALPPGRVKVSWDFNQDGEIIKKERSFVIEVDWSISTADKKIEKKIAPENTESSESSLWLALTLGGVIVLVGFAIRYKHKSKFMVIILLIVLGTSYLLYPKVSAFADEEKMGRMTSPTIINPAECVENNANLGLQKCLRLWSLQAASQDPDVAVESMTAYIKKFKGSNFEICEILVEYTFEAITLTKGASKALSLVGGKDCGYEGPDTRGIFKAAATFVSNKEELKELVKINDECNTVIAPVLGDETALLCRFPVPWFLLSLTNADLLKSLEMCKEQNIFTPANKCQFWVFGVFFTKYVALYQDSEKESTLERFSTPYESGNEAAICEYFKGGIKKLCYAQAAQTYGQNIEMVNRYQEQCYKLPPGSKKECFEGVGYPLGNLVQLTFKESIQPCLKQPSSEQKGCIVWAITGRSSHHGESIDEMVASIPEKFKKNIEQEINEYGKNI